MKKIYLLFLMLVFIVYAPAQVASTYVFSQSNGTYTPVTTGTVFGNFDSDDEVFVDPAEPFGSTENYAGVGIPIGFNFTYNGEIYDRIAIDYNGWISFGKSALTPSVDIGDFDTYTSLSSSSFGISATLRNRVAALNRDLSSTTTSELRVATIGSGTSQTLVVQWSNVGAYGSANTDDRYNFQIRLQQSTNTISIVYGSFIRTSATNINVQVGLGGTSNADYNNRTTTTNWAASAAGTVNSARMTLSATVLPATGLTYIWALASCLPPATLTFTSIAVPNASISWSAVSGAASYEYAVTNAATPPASGTNTTNTSASVSGLPAGSTIYAYVRTNCGGGSFSAWKSTSYIPPPNNDSCGTPIALTPGTIVNGSTIGATQSIAPAICTGFSSSSAYDVWYRATALSNGSFSISVTGTNGFDAVLGIYHGTCTALVFDICSDTTISDETESIAFSNAVAGTNYFVRVYRYNNSADSVGTFTITASGPALPVTGVVLSGIRNGSKAQLNWQTLTEINNAGFDLQRSADGRSFTGIATIASKANGGNSTAAINYNIDDARPFAGANYYRLKQTDKDGKISYSNIVYLKGVAVNNLTLSAVYPNPTRDILKAAIQSPGNEIITFVITDMMGKTISRQVSAVATGDNTVNINVINLPPGSYLLKTICRNGCETTYQKFTKQ